MNHHERLERYQEEVARINSILLCGQLDDENFGLKPGSGCGNSHFTLSWNATMGPGDRYATCRVCARSFHVSVAGWTPEAYMDEERWTRYNGPAPEEKGKALTMEALEEAHRKIAAGMSKKIAQDIDNEILKDLANAAILGGPKAPPGLEASILKSRPNPTAAELEQTFRDMEKRRQQEKVEALAEQFRQAKVDRQQLARLIEEENRRQAKLYHGLIKPAIASL